MSETENFWKCFGIILGPIIGLFIITSMSIATYASMSEFYKVIDKRKPPILFVHGNSESGESWKDIMERYKKQGYKKLYAIDLEPPAHGSCINYAGQISKYVETKIMPNIKPDQKFSIISHSLGTMSTRYYIKRLGGDKYVSHAIFIAGPLQGISVCDIMLILDPVGQIFKQAQELHTGGAEFLAMMNESPGAEANVKYATLSSPHDHSCTLYEEYQKLEWADNRVLPYLGHWSIIDSNESFELCRAFIEDRESSLGKEKYPTPNHPFGEWEFFDDFNLGRKYIFTQDGKVTYHDGRKTKQGTFITQSGNPHHLITIQFPEGIYRGLYSLSINNDNLGIKLGRLNGPAPTNYQYPELYYRSPKNAEIASEIVGNWKAIDFGQLGGFGTREYLATFTPDGSFTLDARTHNPSDLIISGKYSTERTERGLKVHFFIQRSTIFYWGVNEYMGGLVEFKNEEMRLTYPSNSRGAPVPQVVDHPTILKRI